MVHPKNAEALGQWYLRLNGFLTIPNFILHPLQPGSARTEVDVVGVRFPHRREFDSEAIDEYYFRQPNTPYLVLAEVKTSRISRNRAWSNPGVVEAILRAVGISPDGEIQSIADSLRMNGVHKGRGLYSTILFIGDVIDGEVQSKYSASPCKSWDELLRFVHHRFRCHRKVKTDVSQWDPVGQALKCLAQNHETLSDFVREARKVFHLPTDVG